MFKSKKNRIIVLILLCIVVFPIVYFEVQTSSIANQMNAILEDDNASIFSVAIEMAPILRKLEAMSEYEQYRVRSKVSEKSRLTLESLQKEADELQSLFK